MAAQALLLSDKQIVDLEEAIFDYLSTQGSRFSKTVESFKVEASIRDGIELGKGQLEKKWVSVLRLQVSFSSFYYFIIMNHSIIQYFGFFITLQLLISSRNELWN